MILTNIEIKRFRSINAISINLSDGVNTFVGPNNVGKSNILQAVALALGDRGERDFDPALDEPYGMKWAYPNITLKFQFEGKLSSEKTLRRYAVEYERQVQGDKIGTKTLAERGELHYRVKFQGTERQEFIVAAGAGDRHGTPEELEKVITQFKSCIRFVYVKSGQDLRGFMKGRFNEVLRSVLKEVNKPAFDAAEKTRAEYVGSLQKGLLNQLRVMMLEEIRQVVPEISDLSLKPSLPALDDMIAGADIQLSDGAVTDLASKGTGVRGGLLVSMLKFLALNSSRSLVLAVEEPESFLHPAAQEEVLADLERLCNKQHISLLISTHSPFMVSRSPAARVMALAKTPQGITEVTCHVAGSHPHRDAISGLFRNRLVPRLLDEASEVNESLKATLVVEGYSDNYYLTTAVERLKRPELLKDIQIVSAEGADDAVLRTLLLRTKLNSPVYLLLDYDGPGREAMKRAEPFKLRREHIITYRDACASKGEGDFEAEDLFPTETLEKLLSGPGADELLAEKVRRPDGSFHIGLTQKGKQIFMELLKSAPAKSFDRFIAVLEILAKKLQDAEERARKKEQHLTSERHP